MRRIYNIILAVALCVAVGCAKDDEAVVSPADKPFVEGELLVKFTADVVDVIMADEGKVCRVIVPDDQLSLAIGKEGQNARLAARLTGYKIDIKPESYSEDAETV